MLPSDEIKQIYSSFSKTIHLVSNGLIYKVWMLSITKNSYPSFSHLNIATIEELHYVNLSKLCSNESMSSLHCMEVPRLS